MLLLIFVIGFVLGYLVAMVNGIKNLQRSEGVTWQKIKSQDKKSADRYEIEAPSGSNTSQAVPDDVSKLN